MNTTDSDLLFKTDAQLDKEGARQAKLKRTKTVGEPIHLPSKPLALEVRGDEAWTAESGFVLRASNLQVNERRESKKADRLLMSCIFSDGQDPPRL